VYRKSKVAHRVKLRFHRFFEDFWQILASFVGGNIQKLIYTGDTSSVRMFINLSFGFISSKSKEISDEIFHFFSKGVAEGAISEKKNGKDRGKILDFERIEPKTQVIILDSQPQRLRVSAPLR
jgi:hypothetical protein